MSLAVPTLTLIFLLAPGVSYRYAYYSGAFSQQYFKTSFSDLLIAAILPAVIIHAILFYCVVQHYYEIDSKTIGVLLSGITEPANVKAAFSNLYYNAKEIYIYLAGASILAAAAGAAIRSLVRGLRIDRIWEPLRFQNRWHYLFTGEILDFPGQLGSPEEVDFVYVDALVDCDEGSVLYSGILADHILSKDGGLDRIYLSYTKRRYLKENDKEGMKYYSMPGNLFVIPYSKILNLHITYYSFEDANSELVSKVDKGS
ncbi:MAG: hypothetical protein WD824_02710 [Cyclobacteriaceae bacterium]